MFPLAARRNCFQCVADSFSRISEACPIGAAFCSIVMLLPITDMALDLYTATSYLVNYFLRRRAQNPSLVGRPCLDVLVHQQQVHHPLCGATANADVQVHTGNVHTGDRDAVPPIAFGAPRSAGANAA
jgi:hypothetical protein